MFPNYKYKLGIGCAICKHVWFILTNDEKVSEELQLQWVEDILLEHYKIHEENNET